MSEIDWSELIESKKEVRAAILVVISVIALALVTAASFNHSPVLGHSECGKQNQRKGNAGNISLTVVSQKQIVQKDIKTIKGNPEVLYY
jgi:hypothetical protein